jgi:hypothetical protein
MLKGIIKIGTIILLVIVLVMLGIIITKPQEPKTLFIYAFTSIYLIWIVKDWKP